MIHECEDGIVYYFQVKKPASPKKGEAWFDCFDGVHDRPIISVFLGAHEGATEEALIEDVVATVVHEQLHHCGVWGLNCDILL